MTDKLKNEGGEMPHEMVNPNYVERRAFDRIGEEFTETTSLAEAKRMVLEYAMLSAVTSIIGGANTTHDLQERADVLLYGKEWLELIDQTNENKWEGLLKKLKIDAMVIEDDWVGGSKRSVQAVYKIIDMIEESQKSPK